MEDTIKQNNNTVLFPRCIQFISIIMFIALSSSLADNAWNQLAFAKKEVSTLTLGPNMMAISDSPSVFVAVVDSGVFTITLVGDTVRSFPNKTHSGSDDSDRPAGKVHSIGVVMGGAVVFAGTDSGLYTVSMFSATVPAWRPTLMLPDEPVYDIAYNDSACCITMKSRIYKSKYIFSSWSPCSLSGAPLLPGNAKEFSSITSWPLGKGFSAGLNGPDGATVYFADQKAVSWSNMPCIEECTCIKNKIRSLVADSVGTLYAGTSEGIFYRSDFDTGCWHSIYPQLPLSVNEMKTYGKIIPGSPVDLYAATDSGLYKRSLRTTSSGMWQKIFDKKTSSVLITGDFEQPVIYAATNDGVWKYGITTGIASDQKRATTRTPAAYVRTTALYTINGKLISNRVAGKKNMGVYIKVDRDRSGAVVRARRLVQ